MNKAIEEKLDKMLIKINGEDQNYSYADFARDIINVIKGGEKEQNNNIKYIYLSGPITGIKKYFKIFEAYEKILKSKKYDVINPCKLPHNHSKTWNAYMREDLKALEKCDSIFMLPGWRQSRGARLEYDLALKWKKTIYYFIEEL